MEIIGSFTVLAGKYDDGEENIKFSRSVASLDDAIDQFVACDGYPWRRIEVHKLYTVPPIVDKLIGAQELAISTLQEKISELEQQLAAAHNIIIDVESTVLEDQDTTSLRERCNDWLECYHEGPP